MRLNSILAALALLLAVAPSHARSFDEIRRTGKLVVATEGAFAPFNLLENGKLTGFEVELADLVARKLGLGIEWKTSPFDALLPGLEQDRWDVVIASHGITEERARAVSFMAPHYCSGGLLVTRDPAIRGAKDLAGKTVAVQAGTTYLDHVRKLAATSRVKGFPADDEARAALVAGDADAWVSDRIAVLAFLRRNPGRTFTHGDLLFVERVAAAASRGNARVVQAWNEALAVLEADGSYATLSRKYFNEDVRCKTL